MRKVYSLVHNDTGEVVTRAQWDTEPTFTPENHTWHDSDMDVGTIVVGNVITPPDDRRHYASNRAANYPDIREQLDAIYWWATENNWHIAGFTDVVGQVKNTFPKPGGEHDGPPQDNTPVN